MEVQIGELTARLEQQAEESSECQKLKDGKIEEL